MALDRLQSRPSARRSRVLLAAISCLVSHAACSKDAVPLPPKASALIADRTAGAPHVVAPASIETGTMRMPAIASGCGADVVVTRSEETIVEHDFTQLGSEERLAKQQIAELRFGDRRLEITEARPASGVGPTFLRIVLDGEELERGYYSACGGTVGTFGPFCDPRAETFVVLVEGNEAAAVLAVRRDGRHRTVYGRGPWSFDPQRPRLIGAGLWERYGYVELDLARLSRPRYHGEGHEIGAWYWRDGTLRFVGGGTFAEDDFEVDVSAPHSAGTWGGVWYEGWRDNAGDGLDFDTPYLVARDESRLLPGLYAR